MKIELNVTPDDLASIIVDLKYKRCNCKNILQTIFNQVRTDIETNMEELNQLQIISEEEFSGEEKTDYEQDKLDS